MLYTTNARWKYLRVLFGMLSLHKGSIFGEVVISPVNPSISENDSITLACTLTETSETVSFFSWYLKRDLENVSAPVGILTSSCKAFSPINTSLYEYTCPSSRQGTWTIKKVTRQNHGDRYHCNIDTLYGNQNSGETFLNVQVPVSSVTMTVPSSLSVTVRENVSEEFKCKTSGGRPAASVTWFKDSGTPEVSSDDLKITSSVEISSSTVNDLVEVTSTLRYSPSRIDNEWRIYCAASNIDGQTPFVSQRKLLLNVQYPPDGPPVITGYTDSGEYQVIEGTQGQLSCSVSGGNPAPTLTWDCINSGSPQTTSSGTVTKKHSWTAERGQDNTCICRASHYSGNKIVSIQIKTLYTTIQSFYIEGYLGQDNVTVDEHDAKIQFKCTVDSNTASTTRIQFEGEVLKEQTNETSLLFFQRDIACFNAGVYICVGSTVYGQTSSKNVTLFVNCSPRPFRQMRRNITSYPHVPVTLSFTAIAYPEPGPKGFLWHKEDTLGWHPLLSNADLKISSSQLQSNLTLLNVSREDYGKYRVTVTNTIGTYKQHLFLSEEKVSDSHDTDSEFSSSESNNTAFIVGIITLGALCCVLAVYAAYVTISKKQIISTGTRSLNRSAKQTTYANTSFAPDATEHQKQGGVTTGEEEASVQQYTELSRYANTDRDTYDVINKT